MSNKFDTALSSVALYRAAPDSHGPWLVTATGTEGTSGVLIRSPGQGKIFSFSALDQSRCAYSRLVDMQGLLYAGFHFKCERPN